MRQVSQQVLKLFMSPDALDNAEQYAAENRAVVTSDKNEKIEAEMKDEGKTYRILIKQNE